MVLNFFFVAVSGSKMGEGLSVEHAFPKLDWGRRVGLRRVCSILSIS
jgi:hypothetical protein